MHQTTAAMRVAKGTASRLLELLAALVAVTFLLSFTSLAIGARGATPAGGFAGRVNAAPAATAAGKKAVIVVGPAGSSTSDYIAGARAMGTVFTAAGMDVYLVLHPNATWANVKAVATGADFFAYLGHGNGWPSPYPPFQEDGKDGLGLNPYEGADAYTTKYYGACYLLGGTNQDPLCTAGKNYGTGIQLAPNAVGLWNRLCYADGNGEPGMAIPNQDTAFQRADNFSHSLLQIGARTVFALGWQPGVDIARWLLNEHTTMDGMFQMRDQVGGDPQYKPFHGWIGWKPNIYLDSVRTSGARIHLDPDPSSGYLRAVSGDLDFTTDEWLNGSDTGDTTPPELTDLQATQASNTLPADTTGPVVFTPNGDGISDSLTINHTLSEASYLDISITNSSDTLVKRWTSYSIAWTTSDAWNGTNNAGNTVGDGNFTITVTPKDRAGNIGAPVSTVVKVLTAMRAPKLVPGLFMPTDHDALAQSQTNSVTLDKDANLTWKITTLAGDVVKTAMVDEAHTVGVVSWVWNGTDDSGADVPDGTYWSVVTADTPNGVYSHRLQVRLMPYKVTATKWHGTPGTKITWTIITAEPQSGWPKLTIKQPGLSGFTVSLIKYSSTKFKATITLRSGGTPGQVKATLTGTDTGGGTNVQVFWITLD